MSDNIYQTPQSRLVDDQVEPGYRLYKVAGIGFATFFGTVLAGGLLMAVNFRRLGQFRQARNSLLISIAVLILTLTYSFLAGDGRAAMGPYMVSLASLVVVIVLARTYQDDAVDEHVRRGGQLESNWKAAGIGLLTSIFIILATMGIVAIWLYLP